MGYGDAGCVKDAMIDLGFSSARRRVDGEKPIYACTRGLGAKDKLTDDNRIDRVLLLLCSTLGVATLSLYVLGSAPPCSRKRCLRHFIPTAHPNEAEDTERFCLGWLDTVR